jgi:Zn-dependent protease
MTFLIVLLGWIFSLTLHEFAHALVAYLGGDFTVREKGYLTFNPLKYTHPVYSLLLPLLFLFMGGIGLPGGAVYIETWRLRSRKWVTAVSLAGPSANILLAIILGLLLHFAPVGPTGAWPGLAFLALLQISAAAFNLIPIPPFDGYGAIRPHLDYNLREKMDAFGQVSIFVVFLVFWYVPLIGNGFWGAVDFAAYILGIPLDLASLGYSLFQFWR